MTLLIMTILITLNIGKITYNDIYYNKCNITSMFLSTVISEVIYKKHQL
jgi:hypothetical protein